MARDSADATTSAREMALSINKAERTGGRAFKDSLDLIGKFVQAREDLRLPPTYLAGTLVRATQAATRIAEGMEHIALCHEDLKTAAPSFGIDVTAFGDECGWPTGPHASVERTPLRVVGG